MLDKSYFQKQTKMEEGKLMTANAISAFVVTYVDFVIKDELHIDERLKALESKA